LIYLAGLDVCCVTDPSDAKNEADLIPFYDEENLIVHNDEKISVDHRFVEDGSGLIISMGQKEIRLIRDTYHEIGIEISDLRRLIYSQEPNEISDGDPPLLDFRKSMRGIGFLFGRKIEFVKSDFETMQMEKFEVHLSAYDKDHHDRIVSLHELANRLRHDQPIDETYKKSRNVEICYDMDGIDRGFGYERGTFINISLSSELFEEIYRSLESSNLNSFKIWVRFYNAFKQVKHSEDPESINFFAPLIQGWGVLHGKISSLNIEFDDSR
jgi:hypothetical protein